MSETRHDPRPGARRGIAILAVVLFLILVMLKWLGIDRTLLNVLGFGAGLFVLMVWLTYRSFERIATAARQYADREASGDPS
ncbi:MAG: hypothetical protein ACRC7G_12555 [Beijerinckiaceae bacterium]